MCAGCAAQMCNAPLGEMLEVTGAVLAAGWRSRRFLYVDPDPKIDLPETRVLLDRERIADLGFDLATVGRELGTLLGGNHGRLRRHRDRLGRSWSKEASMSLDLLTLVAILAMAAITYLTRIAGIFVAGRLALRGRAEAAFEAIPPAVLVAVIAPMALATGWRETVAALLTAIAATRLPLLATIATGVLAVVALRVLA
jgi:uncharacterized membrane protein